MFDLTVDLKIEKFTLNDYKYFCKGIDCIINNNYISAVMEVNKIGYLEWEKATWVRELVNVLPELDASVIESIIDFLIFDFV